MNKDFNKSNAKYIFLILQLSIAMCFIGHGAFGIIGKEIWCNYFKVCGINESTAWKLMPWVGSFDILCGLLFLIYPNRLIALWLVVWGVFTALLRPLSGEAFPEFIERAGNFGAPMSMLIFTVTENNFFKPLFAKLQVPIQIKEKKGDLLVVCLQTIVFLLIVGHGMLNLIGKPGLIKQYALIGFVEPKDIAFSVGTFEVLAAIIVLVRPNKQFLVALLVWKCVSELFYPKFEILEWIERGGSYGCILALLFLIGKRN